MTDMSSTWNQSAFGELVGISQQAVSDLLVRGVLRHGDAAAVWLLAYCANLREQAAGRASSGELDLTQERAALAREQRVRLELLNATARGEFAPIALLADVLANASQAIVDRLEQLPATLKRQCPDLPQKASDVVMATLASARNEWVRKTESLVIERLEAEAEQKATETDDADAAATGPDIFGTDDEP